LALSAATVGSAVVYEFDASSDDNSDSSIACFGVGGDGRLVRIASGITRVCWGRANGFPRIRCDTLGDGSSRVARFTWTFKTTDDAGCRAPFAQPVDPNATVAGLGNVGIRTSLQLNADVGFVDVRSDAVARADAWLVVGTAAAATARCAAQSPEQPGLLSLPAQTAVRHSLLIAPLIAPDSIGFELRIQWRTAVNTTAMATIGVALTSDAAGSSIIARTSNQFDPNVTMSTTNTMATLFVSRDALLLASKSSTQVTLTVSNENSAGQTTNDTTIIIDEMRLSSVGVWRCSVNNDNNTTNNDTALVVQLPFYSATVVGATSDTTEWFYRAVDKSTSQFAQYNVAVLSSGAVSLAHSASSNGTVALFKTIDLQALAVSDGATVALLVEWRGRRSNPSTDPFRAFFAVLNGSLAADNSSAFAPGSVLASASSALAFVEIGEPFERTRTSMTAVRVMPRLVTLVLACVSDGQGTAGDAIEVVSVAVERFGVWNASGAGTAVVGVRDAGTRTERGVVALHFDGAAAEPLAPTPPSLVGDDGVLGRLCHFRGAPAFAVGVGALVDCGAAACLPLFDPVTNISTAPLGFGVCAAADWSATVSFDRDGLPAPERAGLGGDRSVRYNRAGTLCHFGRCRETLVCVWSEFGLQLCVHSAPFVLVLESATVAFPESFLAAVRSRDDVTLPSWLLPIVAGAPIVIGLLLCVCVACRKSSVAPTNMAAAAAAHDPQLQFAFSGGGVRSAATCAGVVSGFYDGDDAPTAPAVVASVSGGGYLASRWFLGKSFDDVADVASNSPLRGWSVWCVPSAVVAPCVLALVLVYKIAHVLLLTFAPIVVVAAYVISLIMALIEATGFSLGAAALLLTALAGAFALVAVGSKKCCGKSANAFYVRRLFNVLASLTIVLSGALYADFGFSLLSSTATAQDASLTVMVLALIALSALQFAGHSISQRYASLAVVSLPIGTAASWMMHPDRSILVSACSGVSAYSSSTVCFSNGNTVWWLFIAAGVGALGHQLLTVYLNDILLYWFNRHGLHWAFHRGGGAARCRPATWIAVATASGWRRTATGRPFHMVEFEHKHAANVDVPATMWLSSPFATDEVAGSLGGGFARANLEPALRIDGSQLEAPVRLGVAQWTVADSMTLSAAAVSANMGVYANATMRRMQSALLLTGLTMGAFVNMPIESKFASKHPWVSPAVWTALAVLACALFVAAGAVAVCDDDATWTTIDGLIFGGIGVWVAAVFLALLAFCTLSDVIPVGDSTMRSMLRMFDVDVVRHVERGELRRKQDFRHLYVTDGGHVENLSLLALVRRWMESGNGNVFVVVVDGAQDVGCASLRGAALRFAVERCRSLFRDIKVVSEADDDFEAAFVAFLLAPADHSRTGVFRFKIRCGASTMDVAYAKFFMDSPRAGDAVQYGCCAPCCANCSCLSLCCGAFPDDNTANQFFYKAKMEMYVEAAIELGKEARAQFTQWQQEHGNVELPAAGDW
jgi:hypothetical protein